MNRDELRRGDFTDFFAAVNGGARPWRWQERLLDHLLEHGCWPVRLVAPTGAGKTSAIDVHVFAQALTLDDDAVRLPRRLAMVVGRRVLVDDQYRRALRLAAVLGRPGSQAPSVVRVVADRLRGVHRPGGAAASTEAASPLVVARLRGGQPTQRSWQDLPTAVAVLCATPDMWGSRLLLRGYGSSSRAWSRAAGLLAVDAAVVVDEAHLARQLMTTARRVAELVTVGDAAGVLGALPTLQVVETTATPPDQGGDETVNDVAVEADDLATEPALARRLQAPKPVDLRPVDGWPGVDGPARRRVDLAVVDATVEAVARARASGASLAVGGVSATVGCFVNTVSRAVAVATELRTREPDGRPLRVVVVCGQVRPYDLALLEERYPDLLTPVGNGEVDVLVSTQSLEVGVDLDLAGIVTELAPAPSLAQRAGRVNRRGLRPSGPVVVVGPAESLTDRQRSGPYLPEDLTTAWAWLEPLAAAADGLSPWVLRGAAPPAPRPRRTLLQRPELHEALHWARSSDDLAARPELELWLDDDLGRDLTVDVVVRKSLPADDAQTRRLMAVMPPLAGERFSVPLRTARAAVSRLVEVADQVEDDHPSPTILRMRGDESHVLELQRRADGSTPASEVAPGDVLVLGADAALFTSGGADGPPVLLPEDGGRTSAHPADDVSEVLPQGEAEDGRVVLRLEAFGDDPHDLAGLLRRLAVVRQGPDGDGDPDGGPSQDDVVEVAAVTVDNRCRSEVHRWLRSVPSPTAMQQAALRLVETPDGPQRWELDVHERASGTDERPVVVRAVVLDRRRLDPDAGLRQVWAPGRRTVTLDDHQSDVADRAVVVARSLSLPEEAVEVLRLAGLLHDEGKRDRRFQRRLGARAGQVLAKSRTGTSWAQVRARQERDGLPAGWRHEQLSVLRAWDALDGHEADRDLVVRLVGTSHGHGRVTFPHTAAELLAPGEVSDAALDLFDAGAWDELVEGTDRRLGVWVCAYAEALLRAADNQVSEEGH